MILELITFLKEGVMKLIFLFISFFLSLFSGTETVKSIDVLEQFKKNESIVVELSNKDRTITTEKKHKIVSELIKD
jgi:hypothetical protein